MAYNAASLYREKGQKGRYNKLFKEENASTIDKDTTRNFALSKRRKMESMAMTWEDFNNGLKISLRKTGSSNEKKNLIIWQPTWIDAR